MSSKATCQTYEEYLEELVEDIRLLLSNEHECLVRLVRLMEPKRVLSTGYIVLMDLRWHTVELIAERTRQFKKKWQEKRRKQFNERLERIRRIVPVDSQAPTPPTSPPEVSSTSSPSPAVTPGPSFLARPPPSPTPGPSSRVSRTPSPAPGPSNRVSRPPLPAAGPSRRVSRPPSPKPGPSWQVSPPPSPVPASSKAPFPRVCLRLRLKDKINLIYGKITDDSSDKEEPRTRKRKGKNNKKNKENKKPRKEDPGK